MPPSFKELFSIRKDELTLNTLKNYEQSNSYISY